MKEHGICAKCKKSVGCPYADDRIKGCKKFVLEDELELTNEEVLRQCTTEQLADLMSRILGCSNCPIPKDGRSCMGTYSGCWQEIIKWLKQPHREENEK